MENSHHLGRIADALERIAAAQETKAEKPKRQRRERVEPEALPVEDVKLEGVSAQVFEALDRLARTNATKTRKDVRPVKAAAVLRALEDFPTKDHLGVARDYAAWQEHSARIPHVDVTGGFRNQLKTAPDVRRGGPVAPSEGPTPGLDRLMSDDALEEAWR